MFYHPHTVNLNDVFNNHEDVNITDDCPVPQPQRVSVMKSRQKAAATTGKHKIGYLYVFNMQNMFTADIKVVVVKPIHTYCLGNI